MIIHDISITTTTETITWEGTEQGLAIDWVYTIGPTSDANVSAVSYGSHTGTHLDAPRHFVSDGATVEDLDLDTLIGAVDVVEIFDNSVTASALEAAGIPDDCVRIIFKTDNTARALLYSDRFHRDYVGVAPDAAQWIVDNGIALVGIDYLSVGPYGDENVATHQTLLGAGVVLLEGLNLASIAPGRYFLSVLPPKIAGVEGCPCRAVLIEGIL